MIRIIISPAKKMNVADDYPVEVTVPCFLDRTEAVKEYLQGLDYGQLKEIWKCNDKIAELNQRRLRDMNLQGRVTPAVLAYEGIQYQSMAPGVFERAELDYVGEHLYILSGFYGILRAFDGVVPYRLEMQARLAWQRDLGKEMTDSLYDYWGGSLYRVLTAKAPLPDAAQQTAVKQKTVQSENVVIVNLASKEYSKCIEPWLTEKEQYITCVFGEEDKHTGKVKVKATAAKMARGAMVRFMAEKQVTEPEQIKEFDRMGYGYREDLSDDETYVFVVG